MTQEKANCCELGGRLLFRYDGENEWNCWTPDGDYAPWFKFCPFCGADLTTPKVEPPALTRTPILELGRQTEWDELITFLRHSGPPQRLVFDVDGVVCSDKDQTIPYADRPPYPQAVEVIKALKEAGHTIIWQTARYMRVYDGDQGAASERGGQELRWWLKEHGIPADEVYLGKSAGVLYVDDRGCRVSSNRGNIDWIREFSRVFRETLCQSTSSNATAATPSAT